MVLFEKILPLEAARSSEPEVLILPGIHGSPRLHWQTHWQRMFGFHKVEFGDWDAPTLHGWTKRLEEAVESSSGPVILVAHSLGCLAAAWWAKSSAHARRVTSALLVAPPDVDCENCPTTLRDFRPAPDVRLPFRSVLAASRNDPLASFGGSERMARRWGSELVDCGDAGHMNADSGLGFWTEGVSLLIRLMERGEGTAVRSWLLRSAF